MKIFATALLLTVCAFGQSWVEQRTFVSKGRVTPRVGGLVTGSFTRKLGGFLWFQTEQVLSGQKSSAEKGYGQAYGGPVIIPTSWLQVGVGIGIEEAEDSRRAGGFVWVGNEKNSLLFVPEYGGSGFWWKFEANRKLSKAVGLGFISERFKGSGPRVEYHIPKIPFVVWAAPTLDRDPDTRKFRINAFVGLRWNL